MAQAGGYVLHLDPGRRKLFETLVRAGEVFSEPVRDFAHARSAPLICFITLDGRSISHIGSGRRGVVAGTALRRLNVQEIHHLAQPIPIDQIIAALNSRSRSKATDTLTGGGLFTPKAFEAAVDAVTKVSEEARPLLERFSRLRRQRIAALSPEAKRALGEQKEAVLSALAIAGIDRRELHDWSPPSQGTPTSFLDGLPSAVVREDAMIVNDLFQVPGFDLVKQLPYTGAVFTAPGKHLTVLLANRLPLEQLTGTDLIYYNETYKAFVMVQYKAMAIEGGASVFRLPDKGLNKEILRMQAMEQALSATPTTKTTSNYRLNSGPFYIKLCSRMHFNPDDIKLFPGMYFSLAHWLSLSIDPAIVGARGGQSVSYENAGRYLDNDLFIRLVGAAWIGTHVEHSTALSDAIRGTLEAGKAIALAVEHDGPPND